MINKLYENIKPVWYWWPWFMLFNIFDMITTLVFLSKGYAEGNPLFHDSVYSPPFIIFKMFVVPCLVIPLLAIILSRTSFPALMRILTFMLLEVVVWNIVGMLRTSAPTGDAEPYSFLEMFGLMYFLMIGATVLSILWGKIGTYATSKGLRWDLAGMMVGIR